MDNRATGLMSFAISHSFSTQNNSTLVKSPEEMLTSTYNADSKGHAKKTRAGDVLRHSYI